MKERPILFSAPMVCAILDGSKTQTRRVVKNAPHEAQCGLFSQPFTKPDTSSALFFAGPTAESPGLGMVTNPYGKPGDRLWVRETWMLPTQPVADLHMLDVDYRATLEPEMQGCDREFLNDVSDAILQDALRIWDADVRNARSGWRPGIHMPRWASRLLLEITDVRVERLQSISEADAKAEGVRRAWEPVADHKGQPVIVSAADDEPHPGYTYRNGFHALWWQINGRDSWTANPWVWVVTFKRVTP